MRCAIDRHGVFGYSSAGAPSLEVVALVGLLSSRLINASQIRCRWHRATMIGALFLLASIATGCVEQARSTANPYSYQILVGEWRWWPQPTTQQPGWTAQLTITHVSDWGRVSAIWQDTNAGEIPFTTDD